ncbi:MAG: DNA-deoxyinosine glycosylase [Sphaerochaetaceae bacterium]
MTDGFPPIEDRNAVVLILGTGPSLESLRKGEYYGHKMNGFWPIMGMLFHEEPKTYEEKRRMLLRHHVALWDVLSRFERVGSLDSGYKKVESNDLVPFISVHKNLEAVLFTGKTAESLYRRLVGFYPSGIWFHALPSPSSANTMPIAGKRELYAQALGRFLPLSSF